MARLPYLDQSDLEPQHRDLLARNISLYRQLVHSPDALRAFQGLGQYIRFGSKLDPRLRELAILQVGYLARSPYEWSHHVKIAYDFGVTDDDIRAMIDDTEGRETSLDAATREVLRGAREATLNMKVSDATFAALRAQLDGERIVDLVLTIAFYSAVVRVLASLEVDVEPDYQQYLDKYPLPPGAPAKAGLRRLENKVAVVVGAGQGPGEGMGNGRATAILFAREGARVVCVDNNLASAEETVAMANGQGGEAIAAEADVTRDASLEAMIEDAVARWGRIDVLHYNVGVSLAGGDRSPLEITEEAFDRINAINLRGFVMACKHALPVMRRQRAGSIISISSVAALSSTYATVAYKTTKAGMIAYTEQIARHNAEFGVRANVILPGLMNTPMAVDTRVREWGQTREQVVAARDARVPLRRKMGTAWDVARAALFLASDEADFITGVALPVDGGALLRSGD
jgi:NAD(P)-dependent dehydrogenase (short-subunit alcohol dehydrogenase family)/alkylhydroperoxidase family enzyme